MLIRLVYASTAADSVDAAEFRRILDTAVSQNQSKGLTGMLAFNSRYFLQALEGSRDEVSSLYAKLTKDKRHHSLLLLKLTEIAERAYAEWSMGFASPSTDNRSLFLKYSPVSTFNPYLMSGGAAESLLMELTKTTFSMGSTAMPEALVAASTKPPIVELQPEQPAASGVFSRIFNRNAH